MYSRMMLMVVCWLYGMSFDANGWVSILVNVDWIEWTYFCINEFEVGVDCIFLHGKVVEGLEGRLIDNNISTKFRIMSQLTY